MSESMAGAGQGWEEAWWADAWKMWDAAGRRDAEWAAGDRTGADRERFIAEKVATHNQYGRDHPDFVDSMKSNSVDADVIERNPYLLDEGDGVDYLGDGFDYDEDARRVQLNLWHTADADADTHGDTDADGVSDGGGEGWSR